MYDLYDYKQLVNAIAQITEEDLILFKVSAEEKAHIVKQFNRALVNAKGDGTDVAQIFLKPLISKYPTWGDAALVFGLCLAQEFQFNRAAESFEFAINNVLSTETNLAIAQQALKWVREDATKPVPKMANPNATQGKDSLVGEMGAVAGRSGMQAPILMRASHGSSRPQMASDKERREIMMRAASSNGELPDDDIMVDVPSTPGERARLMVKIIAGLIALAAVVCLVIFVIVPTVVKVRNANESDKKLQYLTDKLGENIADPTVASILNDYADQFVDKKAVAEATSDATTTSAETTTSETTTETTTEATTTELKPSFATEEVTTEPVEDGGEGTPVEGEVVPEEGAPVEG